SIASLVERTLERFGRLDVACNNAAHSDHFPTLLAELPTERFDAALGVNLRGVFLGMKYEIPAMLRNGGGAIVNMSSTARHHGVHRRRRAGRRRQLRYAEDAGSCMTRTPVSSTHVLPSPRMSRTWTASQVAQRKTVPGAHT